MGSSVRSLREIREDMSRFAAAFEPGEYTAADASVLVQHAARIEKMAATVKSLAAARVAKTGLGRRGGGRTPAHELANSTGSSVGEAKDALDTAEKLDDLPVLNEAARAGRVSAKQAALIADAATADPSKERQLVDLSQSASVRELAEECARVKAAAEPDPDANYKRIHRDRRVRQWTDRGGAAHLHATGPADAIAKMLAALEPARKRRFEQARSAGEHEPAEAYLFDALLDTLSPADTNARRSGEPRPKIVVRIDWDALVRGWPIDGEVCEIPGIGPVPVSIVEAIIDSGDAFLTAVVTRGVDVVNVAHLKRRPTAYQRSALEWLSPECTVEGCATIAHLQVDHTDDWAKTKITLLRLLEHLCGHHHHLKTHQGWALTPGRGKRPLVPPDDPRHPNNTSGNDPPTGQADAA